MAKGGRENHSLGLNYKSAAVAVGVALEKSNLNVNQIPRLPYFQSVLIVLNNFPYTASFMVK